MFLRTRTHRTCSHRRDIAGRLHFEPDMVATRETTAGGSTRRTRHRNRQLEYVFAVAAESRGAARRRHRAVAAGRARAEALNAMAQNIYDQPDFFAGYSQFQRSIEGLAGAPEWPTLCAMLPSLQGRRVLDLGCGFGAFARWARSAGA